jgi:WD40 repeat protein
MIRVWRASDLKLMRVLRGHRGSVLCLLAVGNLLLSGARDNAIRYGLPYLHHHNHKECRVSCCNTRALLLDDGLNTVC